MKNILILLLLLQSSCSSLPTKDGEVSYSELHNSTAKIHIVHPDFVVIENRELLYDGLIKEIHDGWPDLRIEQNTNVDSPYYCLDIEVLNYNAEYDTRKTTETVDKKEVHYIVYETRTILDFKYNLINMKTKQTVFSKSVKATDSKENREVDSCYSSNILKEMACDIILKPINDAMSDMLFSRLFGSSNDKYPTTVSYEEMFSTAGSNIAKSLPKPKCSSDGYSTCVAHFFRNTLGF